MEIKKVVFPKPDEAYNKPILVIQNDEVDIQYGTVLLKKGTRIPEKGFSKHPQYEISYVVSGNIELLNEDGSIKGYLKAGDAVYVEAFEAQAGNVLEETRIIYTLIQ